jgi:hypothetical protein
MLKSGWRKEVTSFSQVLVKILNFARFSLLVTESEPY